MNKDTQISLRVRSNQLKKIKELGFKYSDCWQLGYERICENEHQELKKLVEKYYNLYIHVNTKLENFGKKLDSEYAKLDRLYEWYIKTDLGGVGKRSITNPTVEDEEVLRYQMKKRGIENFSEEQVFEYWRNKMKK